MTTSPIARDRSRNATTTSRRRPRTSGTVVAVDSLMTYVGVQRIAEFARLAGVSRQTVYRWRRTGLDIWTADRLAIRVAHEHPSTVFGPAWFEASEFGVAS